MIRTSGIGENNAKEREGVEIRALIVTLMTYQCLCLLIDPVIVLSIVTELRLSDP
jgi:hypothetical protein